MHYTCFSSMHQHLLLSYHINHKTMRVCVRSGHVHQKWDVLAHVKHGAQKK